MLQGPSVHHLLGTDTLGRDVLTRLLAGGPASLLGAVQALVAFVVVGTLVGGVSGYLGGRIDRTITTVLDMVLSIPSIVLILVVLSMFPGNTAAAMVAFGLLVSPVLARIVRSSALSVRQTEYVASARVSGVREARIIAGHVFPQVLTTVITQASLFAGIALVFQTGLAFLGLLGDTSTPTWGGMVAEAQSVTSGDPWLLVPSGGLLALTVVALSVLGDSTRDASAERTGESTGTRWKRSRTMASGPSPVLGGGRGESAGALLDVAGLHVRFDGDQVVTVVDGFDLAVNPGECVGIVGESGCGKSVSAMAILGLLPSRAAIPSGSVRFEGRELVNSPEAYREVRGRGIGYVSQHALASLDPAFTVRAQLGEVVRRNGISGRPAVQERIRELLQRVGLVDVERVASSYPHELSGGMAQRVAIAIALAGNPKMLVADEPTTALDVTVQAGILDLLRELRDRDGLAVVLISHDWGVVSDLCDRALVMYAGQVVETGPVTEVILRPRHPYTLGLLQSVPSSTGGGKLAALPGRVPAPQDWPAGCRFAARCAFATVDCQSRGPVELVRLGADRASRCIHVDKIEMKVTT